MAVRAEEGKECAHTMNLAMALRIASSCLVGLLSFSNMYSYFMLEGLALAEALLGGGSFVGVAMMAGGLGADGHPNN